jgi:hypothetical protein
MLHDLVYCLSVRVVIDEKRMSHSSGNVPRGREKERNTTFIDYAEVEEVADNRAWDDSAPLACEALLLLPLLLLPSSADARGGREGSGSGGIMGSIL